MMMGITKFAPAAGPIKMEICGCAAVNAAPPLAQSLAESMLVA
jgi:hypothetical protein